MFIIFQTEREDSRVKIGQDEWYSYEDLWSVKVVLLSCYWYSILQILPLFHQVPRRDLEHKPSRQCSQHGQRRTWWQNAPRCPHLADWLWDPKVGRFWEICRKSRISLRNPESNTGRLENAAATSLGPWPRVSGLQITGGIMVLSTETRMPYLSGWATVALAQSHAVETLWNCATGQPRLVSNGANASHVCDPHARIRPDPARDASRWFATSTNDFVVEPGSCWLWRAQKLLVVTWTSHPRITLACQVKWKWKSLSLEATLYSTNELLAARNTFGHVERYWKTLTSESLESGYQVWPYIYITIY